MLVLEVRNTSNEVISLADNNVINETFHKSIPLHWFQGTQNLLTANLNLNKRLTLCQLLNHLLWFFNILATWYQKFCTLLSVLRNAYWTRSHFPTLGLQKNPKDLKITIIRRTWERSEEKLWFLQLQAMKLSEKHIEHRCTQTEK